MAKKILVVDDEHDVVSVVSVRLKANNYEVIAAYDGLQAISVAHKEKPDLILLDYMMPADSGVGVYKKLQKSNDTAIIPVIFLTARAGEEVKKEVLEMGAAGFISKPYKPKDLLGQIRKVLGETNKEDDNTYEIE